MNNFNPSFSESWFYWRRKETEPNYKPFSELIRKYNLQYPFTHIDWLYINDGKCPKCENSYTILNIEGKNLLCLCETLKKQGEFLDRSKPIRRSVKEAYTDDFIIPQIYDYEHKKKLINAHKITKKFIENPRKWLLFYGNYGTGKTLLARIINTLFEPISLYISAKDIEHLTHRYRKDDNLDEFYTTLEDAPILIMDDIGSEYGGDLVKSIIERIIDKRYELFPQLPTVFITNLNARSLQSYLPRATDRLMDMEVVVKVDMNNRSFRHLTKGERK